MKTLRAFLLIAAASTFSAATAMADIYSDPPGNNNDDASVTGPANTEVPDSDAVNVDPDSSAPMGIDGGAVIEHDEPNVEVIPPPAAIEQ